MTEYILTLVIVLYCTPSFEQRKFETELDCVRAGLQAIKSERGVYNAFCTEKPIKLLRN